LTNTKNKLIEEEVYK
jgi:hypothetical protein